MPSISLYRCANGRVPVADTLALLRRSQPKAFAACLVKIEQLKRHGFRLGMPAARPLGDGLHELRATAGGVPWRIGFCFIEGAAVLLHAFRAHVSPAEDDRALALSQERRAQALLDREAHTTCLADVLPGCLSLPGGRFFSALNNILPGVAIVPV